MPDEPSQFQEAIAAIKAGDKAKGRRLLSLFLQDNPTHENALLWLSATTNSPTEKRRYFERVLQINPYNEKAKQALAKLDDADEAPGLEVMTGESTRPAPPAAPIQVVMVAPSKPAWSYFANLLIVALAIFGCIIYFLWVSTG